MNYNALFDSKIGKLKIENRYRVFKEINRNTDTFPVVTDTDGNKITVWCSNDYLGLGVHKDIVKAALNAINEYGVGSGGTRNIGGTHREIIELENSVAKLNQQEAGLVFTSGFVANVGTISAIIKMIPDIIVFSDEKNHASIINGIKSNNAEKHIFKHNDMLHLEGLVSQYSVDKPKIIIFEGVYSMDGTIGDMLEIVKIAKKYNCLTYVDEVHSVGLYGSRGAGITNLFGLENDIDIIQGNFAKGLGVVGGYIAGKKNIIDAIRSYSSDLIFTTSLPPAICAAAKKSIEIVMSSEGLSLRNNQMIVVKKTKELLFQNGLYDIKKDNPTHIIPIIIGDAKKAEKISQNLYNNHAIYVQNINYPTVSVGSERLRITPTPYHTDLMINDLVKSLIISSQKEVI